MWQWLRREVYGVSSDRYVASMGGRGAAMLASALRDKDESVRWLAGPSADFFGKLRQDLLSSRDPSATYGFDHHGSETESFGRTSCLGGHA